MNRLSINSFVIYVLISYSVNVTFRVNSSTVQGIVDSTSGVDLRGSLLNNWAGPWESLTSDGGDYWSLTIALESWRL